MRPGNEHDHEHRRADQRRRSQIDLGHNQKQRAANNREWDHESLQKMAAFLFPGREPRRQKKDDSDLCDFRWLKRGRAERDPASRAVDSHSEMRDETKGERDEGERKPDPPSSQPEMVVDDGGRRANDESNADPDRLAFHEEIHVAVAVLRERARAEKHDDADDQHPQHSEKQEVSTLAMHSVFLDPIDSLLRFFRFSLFFRRALFFRDSLLFRRWDDELLADL